jgi:hypothetical protein
VQQGGGQDVGDDGLAAAADQADQADGAVAAADEKLQLRKLVLADFQAALEKVAPAAVDAQHSTADGAAAG